MVWERNASFYCCSCNGTFFSCTAAVRVVMFSSVEFLYTSAANVASMSTAQ